MTHPKPKCNRLSIPLASFAIYALNGGGLFTFGVMLPDIIRGLNTSEVAISGVGSLLFGMTLASTVLVGGLVEIMDCRMVSITGSLIAGGGFILSSRVTSVSQLYFTCGVLSGMGFGLQFMPVPITIHRHLYHERNFATGFAASGSGVGTFIFAPLCRQLLDSYGWRGTYLILGALILNGIPLACALKPPSHQTEHTDENNESDSKPCDEYCSKSQHKDGCDKQYSATNCEIVTDFEEKKECEKNEEYEKVNIQTSLSDEEGNKGHDMDQHNKQLNDVEGNKGHDMDQHNKQLNDVEGIDSIHTKNKTNVAKNKNLLSLQIVKSHLRTLLDFSVIKDASFRFVLVSMFFKGFAANIPWIWIPSKASSIGMSSTHVSFLISAAGIADTVGRVLFGALGSCIPNVFLLIAACFLSGVLSLSSTFITSFAFMTAYSILFGLLFGCYITTQLTAVADLLDLTHIGKAFSLMFFVISISTMMSFPLVAYVARILRNQDVPLYACALGETMTALVLIVLSIWKKKYKNDKSITIDSFHIN